MRLGRRCRTTKAIGAKADVDGALVNRYFGTKEALFKEAAGLCDDETPAPLEAVLAAEPPDLPGALAAYLVGKEAPAPDSDGPDPMVILAQSAVDPEGAPLLRAAVQDQLAGPLARRLVRASYARGPERRAGLVAALVLGHTPSNVFSGPSKREASGSRARPHAPHRDCVGCRIKSLLKPEASCSPHSLGGLLFCQNTGGKATPSAGLIHRRSARRWGGASGRSCTSRPSRRERRSSARPPRSGRGAPSACTARTSRPSRPRKKQG